MGRRERIGGSPAGGSLSPPAAAGAPPPVSPDTPRSSRRGRPERTTGRAELGRHQRFEELSPEVGELDLDAVRDAVAEDADDILPLLALMSRATDPLLRARVQALVPRLVVDRARSGPSGRIGSGRLRTVRADLGGDLDLDASLDAVSTARGERRPPSMEELRASAWQRPTTALCLLVDRSGSMDGHRLATAAMAAAACALRSAESGAELGVVAFDRRAEVVHHLGAPCRPQAVVERVLGLRGHGMTSLDTGLRAAAQQLAGARARRRITVLLSDCRVTDDVNPEPVARALDELLIVAPRSDDEEAYRFARATGARVASLESLTELPDILDRLLAP